MKIAKMPAVLIVCDVNPSSAENEMIIFFMIMYNTICKHKEEIGKL